MRFHIKAEYINDKYPDFPALLLLSAVYAASVKLCLQYSGKNSAITVAMAEAAEFSELKFFICITATAILYLITEALVKDEKRFSSYIIRFLFFIYQMPVIMSFCLFHYSNYFIFWILEMAYWINICMLINFTRKYRIKFKSCLQIKINQKILRGILLMLVISGVLYSISKLSNFRIKYNLDGIYRIRTQFGQDASDFMTYFKSALGVYICPCFIAFYGLRKRYWHMMLFSLLQIIMFSFAGDKSILFLLPVSVAIGIFGKAIVQNFRFYLKGFYLLYTGILLLAIADIFREFIFGTLTRRLLLVPSWLNYIFYDFIADNVPIWWRQDTFLIDKLFTPVYSSSLTSQIDRVYLGSLVGNPNAGMFAEAYSRCGYAGVIIYPALMVILFRLLDQCFANIRTEIVILLAAAFSISLQNDTITSTSFVGILLLVLLGTAYFRETNLNSCGQQGFKRYGDEL